VSDLGVPIAGAMRVDRGEDPMLPFGGGAQERMHPRSVEARASRRRGVVDDAGEDHAAVARAALQRGTGLFTAALAPREHGPGPCR
jgi:hypothetical protein